MSGFCKVLFVLSFVLAQILPASAQSNPKCSGEKIYNNNCQNCHRQGRNPLNPEKELAESTKLVSETVFKDFLSKKHGLMPKFDKLSDNESELSALYGYIKTLKNQSWEYPQKEPGPKDAPMKDRAPSNNPQ